VDLAAHWARGQEGEDVMPYTAEISRSNPSCLMFLIDQSGSMGDSFAGNEARRKKCTGVADAINKLLQNLVIKCAKEEGVRDYFSVAVIGYGAQVGSAYVGQLAGRELVPISEIANLPARVEERTRSVEDGAGGLVNQAIRFPIWFDPIANGGTPMCEAFGRAASQLETWVAQHPNAFPPVVINITDGEATDGDPSAEAEKIKKLRTSDGETLLFNVHLSAAADKPIEFPESETGLPDQYAQLLFRMSSVLPEHLLGQARNEGYRVTQGSKGFVFNADLVAVVKFLDIGTRPSNLR
jgi:hypothetical protein